jgi:tetratricopeptide (TPR) repeat protein
MPMSDRYGLPVSTSSAAALEHYQEGIDRLLAYRSGAEDQFRQALARDEGLALAHAGLAACALLMGNAPSARTEIARAGELVAGATRRERQHVEALTAICTGQSARGIELVEEHVKDFPRDALPVNQASSAIGFSGRPDREQARTEFLERLAPAYGDDWWFQSALSFVYHEVRRFAESRTLSERSLAQYPANGNASHNIAHIFFEAGDYDGGVAYLEPWLAAHDRGGLFGCHLAWHVALFELHRGRPERAFEIHQKDIERSGNPRMTMMDGPALLWRCQIYGCHEGALPWRAMADVAAQMARPGFIFGDVHAALAYAGSGDTAAMAKLIDGLRDLDAKGHPIAGKVALPLVLGVAAFAAGDHATALAHIEPVDAEIHRIGGSHAQWELFEETMVVCQLKLGRLEDAARLVRRRLAIRPSLQDKRWLAQTEAA